jgi:ABC-type bacteriocin/lantibiotic exporter with double-glycine peptidase domain/CRP-like cAMP-binding protein
VSAVAAAPGALLHDLPALGLLPPELRERVIDRFVPVRHGFGSVIVREGDEADGLYVLASGRARVLTRDDRGEEVSLAALGPGDSFGEMALLERGPRTATVRASSDVLVLRLEREAFEDLVARHPEIRDWFHLQVRHRALHNCLRECSALGALPPAPLALLLDALEPRAVAAGALVIRQGDPAGPMYVVQEGRLRVFAESGGERRDLAYLRRGDVFGELSLITGAPRAASVQAVAPSALLALPPEVFARLHREHPTFARLIAEQTARYESAHVARVPLDFAPTCLPAPAGDSAPTPGSGPPAGDPDGTEVPGLDVLPARGGWLARARRRLRGVEMVYQVDERDCGAAALAMVCRHHGRRVALVRIRQLTQGAADGASLSDLCRAAQALGLSARSVKASRRHLDSLPLPAIAHWEGNHWVVICDVAASVVRVADPALGERALPRTEFEARWTGYVALFDYTDAFADAPEGSPSAAWLWPFLRPHAGVLARAAGLAGLASGLSMLLPVFTQVVVDRVVVEQDTGLLRTVVVGMLGVLGLMVASMTVQRYLLSWVGVRVDAATLDHLTRRLLALPVTYFHTRRTGDIQRRLAGTRQLREFLVQQGTAGLTAAVQLLAAVALMVAYSPRLTAVFLATAPLYALLMRASARWLRPTFQSLEEGFGRYFSHQLDAIKGMETVKALGAEPTFRQLMLGEFHGVARRLFRADFTTLCYDGAVQAVGFLSILLFLWAGAQQVMAGALSIGALVAFNSLVMLATGPIGALLSLWDNAQLASVLLARLDDVFEQEPEQGADHSRLLPVPTLEGRVELRHLSFRYGGPESPLILDDVSLEVPAGQRVAVVGRSGSGKTTLVRCLAGLLEPTAGAVLYDGVDGQTLDRRDLRRHLGCVLQDSHLFDDTIARNIALGEDEPDPERVRWAARVASAHEFVERLPLGYDTRVGETGVLLSGGQRQRIAIARAVYRQPPVLIFDEATSALDTESERAIRDNLGQLLAGRTAFVIAHRLSTIRDADLILVLEKGRLVERGNHDDLMRRQGLYHHLVGEQLGA